jgi:hypothetical protein
MLGLDAERLVDEFRRQVETNADGAPRLTFGEPVLERRMRPGERIEHRSYGFVWAALAIAAAVVAALVIGSSGSDEAGSVHRHGAGHEGKPGGSVTTPAPTGPVTLSLVARKDIRACLVREGGEAVIDAQALDAGSTAGPFQPADRYRLDLESGGAVDLKVNGRTLVARAPRAASFVITSAGARPIAFAGPRCP